MSDIINSFVIPFGGSSLMGYICGYAAKKLLKIAVKVGAIVMGLFIFGIILMQKQGYLTGVNFDKMGNDIYAATNNIVQSNVTDGGGIMNYFQSWGLPVSSGFVMGFGIGVIRTH